MSINVVQKAASCAFWAELPILRRDWSSIRRSMVLLGVGRLDSGQTSRNATLISIQRKNSFSTSSLPNCFQRSRNCPLTSFVPNKVLVSIVLGSIFAVGQKDVEEKKAEKV